MSNDSQADAARDYALGANDAAARRLEIQDAQFAAISERLLDRLSVRPSDRVVELGIGAGSFTRRLLRRLGPEGTLIGIDKTQGLLDQAAKNLVAVSSARMEFQLADINDADPWLANADVLAGRTVLHHLPMPEVQLGRWRSILRPGTRLGFIEPELLYYDEIRDRYAASGTMTVSQIARDQELLRALSIENLPAVWGMYCVTCMQP